MGTLSITWWELRASGSLRKLFRPATLGLGPEADAQLRSSTRGTRDGGAELAPGVPQRVEWRAGEGSWVFRGSGEAGRGVGAVAVEVSKSVNLIPWAFLHVGPRSAVRYLTYWCILKSQL